MATTMPQPPDEPPKDAIDPDLVAEDDRGHVFAESSGRDVCLACGTERRGVGRARRYRARDGGDWSPFPPKCNGPLFS